MHSSKRAKHTEAYRLIFTSLQQLFEQLNLRYKKSYAISYLGSCCMANYCRGMTPTILHEFCKMIYTDPRVSNLLKINDWKISYFEVNRIWALWIEKGNF